MPYKPLFALNATTSTGIKNQQCSPTKILVVYHNNGNNVRRYLLVDVWKRIVNNYELKWRLLTSIVVASLSSLPANMIFTSYGCNPNWGARISFTFFISHLGSKLTDNVRPVFVFTYMFKELVILLRPNNNNSSILLKKAFKMFNIKLIEITFHFLLPLHLLLFNGKKRVNILQCNLLLKQLMIKKRCRYSAFLQKRHAF